MKWLILDTLEEWLAVNHSFNEYLGFPSEEEKTVTYAEPLEHNGKFAICIQDRVMDRLSSEGTKRLVSTEEMEAQGWFHRE